MPGKYYLAYGSNLSIEQMKVRTPDAAIAGTSLENFRAGREKSRPLRGVSELLRQEESKNSGYFT